MTRTLDAQHMAATASVSRSGAALGFGKPWGTCGNQAAMGNLLTASYATTKRPARHLGMQPT